MKASNKTKNKVYHWHLLEGVSIFNQRKIRDKFLSQVSRDKTTKCWNWTGSRNNKGFGHFSYNGIKPGAHKFSYILFHGLIPDSNNVRVHHSCDNPSCVSPYHLFLKAKRS